MIVVLALDTIEFGVGCDEGPGAPQARIAPPFPGRGDTSRVPSAGRNRPGCRSRARPTHGVYETCGVPGASGSRATPGTMRTPLRSGGWSEVEREHREGHRTRRGAARRARPGNNAELVIGMALPPHSHRSAAAPGRCCWGAVATLARGGTPLTPPGRFVPTRVNGSDVVGD